MGINRIVVTDGKISAKIMYDFQARDTAACGAAPRPTTTRATRMASIQTTGRARAPTTAGVEGHATSTSKDDSRSTTAPTTTAKGDLQVRATAGHDGDERRIAKRAIRSCQTRAQLAGEVEVNFKSDYLPLDKMATPGMIAAIQGNSTPVDPNVVPSAKNRSPPQPANGRRRRRTRPRLTPMSAMTSRHDTSRNSLDHARRRWKRYGRRCATLLHGRPGVRQAGRRRSAASSPATWSRCCPTSPIPNGVADDRSRPSGARARADVRAQAQATDPRRGDQAKPLRVAGHGRRELQGRRGARGRRAVRRAGEESGLPEVRRRPHQECLSGHRRKSASSRCAPTAS